MNNIYVVGLPIGNLDDITLRALNTLKEVDFIYSEKPLKTLKLLNHFEIKKSIFIYSQNPSFNLINQFLEKLKKGSIAVVVEAGTPGISDPGNKLIHDLLETNPDLNIIPIPGVSALTTSLSVTGLNTQEFIFLGFYQKTKKTKFIEKINSNKTVVFYESCHRIKKTLKEIQERTNKENIVICRELTKVYEEVIRDKVENLSNIIEKINPKGEFTIILN